MRGLRVVLPWVTAAAFAVSLAGCARYYWFQPGATAAQFDQDNRECAVRASANPTEASHGIVNDTVYRTCLEARRWTRKKEIPPPPPGSYRGFE